MNHEILLKKLTIGLCFVFYFLAMTEANAYPPIFRPNWDNGMGQSWNAATMGCISLSSDNTVYIGMTINVDPNVNIGPNDAFTDFAIYYTMSIGGALVITGATVPYTSFVSTTDGGAPVQQQKITIPFDCSNYCRTPGQHFYADFTFELIVAGATPSSYPVGYHNSDLWPWATFQEITGLSYVVSQSITKEICCYQPPNPIYKSNDETELAVNQSYLMLNESGAQQKQKSLNEPSQPSTPIGQVIVMPNPFSSTFKVKVNTLSPSAIRFECFDLEGKIINRAEDGYESSGQNETILDIGDVPPGIYYLRVSTPSQTFVAKIVKVKG